MKNDISSMMESENRFLIEEFDIASLFGKEILEEIQEKVAKATVWLLLPWITRANRLPN